MVRSKVHHNQWTEPNLTIPTADIVVLYDIDWYVMRRYLFMSDFNAALVPGTRRPICRLWTMHIELDRRSK